MPIVMRLTIEPGVAPGRGSWTVTGAYVLVIGCPAEFIACAPVGVSALTWTNVGIAVAALPVAPVNPVGPIGPCGPVGPVKVPGVGVTGVGVTGVAEMGPGTGGVGCG